VRRTTHRFVGYVLTPVHIGDGTEMTPDGYRLGNAGDRTILERFDPPAVIAAMSAGLRDQYVAALSKGDLRKAHDYLCKAAGTAITERLAVSENSRGEIKKAIDNPLQRRGSVGRFIRSGGIPILPGSSVKGAIRTAWLAAWPIPSGQVSNFVRAINNAGPGKTGKLSEQLQLAAFDVEEHHTEQDPLRDISVSDARLELDSTVIDQAQVANCTKDGYVDIGDGHADDEGRKKKIQIHVERLASIADRGKFAVRPFKIEIAVTDGEAIKERHRLARARAEGDLKLAWAIPRHSLDLEDLRKATNAHHAALWFYEKERYYRGTKTYRLLDELLVRFGLPVEAEKFEPAINGMGAWLLKVGRFGHFESKSIKIDGRRHGEKAGTKQHRARFMSEGGSRTVAEDADGQLLPFGWILLLPEVKAPTAVPQLQRREGRSSGLYRFRKGDRVTDGDEEATVERDVRTADTTMDVRFDDGEVEPVSVTRWRLVR
jgi:CRISPR-associated protein Csm5